MSEFQFSSARQLHEAYSQKRTDPVAVAKVVLEAVAAWDREDFPLRAFLAQRAEDVVEMAERSKERYENGKPLGPLDGVPVAVKDELHQRGYPTTVGTRFLGGAPETRDATVVDRLRRAGAVLLGKTNMHEVGIGITGINPHHGPARNPYDAHRITGGSSSGSAAAVAAGFCPIAVGADGGGSVRIPASLCGVVGIKGTYGRVSDHGVYPLCWSVAHVGPLASSVADAVLAFEIMAGEDPHDPNTLGVPPMKLSPPDPPPLSSLRLGLCHAFFESADEEVKAVCMERVRALEDVGVSVVEVDLPHLELVRPVQYVTIGVEMASALYEHRDLHKRDFGCDTRILLEAASSVSAVDYVRAQRLRTRIARSFNGALTSVDALVSPTTGRTATPIRDDALSDGESDQEVLEAMTAFSFAANVTGLPSVTVPAGYDFQGLPVGLQLMGRAWDEATLIRLAAEVESGVEKRRPKRHLDLLRASM